MTAFVARGDEPGVDSDDDGPSRKRMRVSRACDACRRRKERCDGVQPSCQRCASVGRPCTYNPFRKRGLRTGYVRGIEILLGLLIHSYEDAEDLIMSALHHSNPVQASPPTACTTVPAAVSLLDTWRKSAALERLQNALAVSGQDEDEESYLQNLDEIFTMAFNAVPRRENNVRANTPPASIVPEDHTRQDAAPSIVDSPALSSRLLRHEVHADVAGNSELSLPSNWPHLIDVYLSSTHCWFPVVQKHFPMRTASLLSYKNSEGGAGNLERPRPGEVVSLWATFAIASYQLNISEHPKRPIFQECGADGIVTSQLYTVAKGLAMQDPLCYDFGHVHGFLILSLLEIIHTSFDKAWFWVGRAVYTATSLGLVPLPNREATKVLADDNSKRLFLGCFILDTLVSMRLGRRPYLNKTDLDNVGKINVDGLEEWESWRPFPNSTLGAAIATNTGLGAPGRALSVFSHLGCLAGLLNSLCPTHSNNIAEASVRIIFDEFLLQLKKMPTMTSQLEEPPHLKHFRLATAITSILIQTKLIKSNTNFSLSREVAGDPLPSSLQDTVALLKSVANPLAVIDVGGLPPTLAIFLHLLQQCQLSTYNAPIQASLSDLRQKNNRQGLQFQENPVQGINISAATANDQNVPPTCLLSLTGVHLPIIDEDSSQTPRQQFSSGQVIQLAVDNIIEDQSQNAPVMAQHRRNSIQSPARHLLQSLQPTDCSGAATVEGGGDGRGIASTVAPLPEGADPDRLFDQLALLDSADW